MKVVGLTGGIGSGKSTVARMFESLGVPVYYADDQAKNLMSTSEGLRASIKARFGEEAYDEKGLNRKFLAEVVFNDTESLKALNALVHPVVERHFKAWVKDQKSTYVLQENPLLFEKGKQDQYDAVIVVTASDAVRISRVMSRDGSTEKEVKARMSHQLDQSYKEKRATFVIQNESDLDACWNAVQKIHKNLLSEIP